MTKKQEGEKMNEDQVIPALRNNPDAFFRNVSIHVEHERSQWAGFGGTREITVSALQAEHNEVFRFSLKPGHMDCYYYPYIQDVPVPGFAGMVINAGSCLVPTDAPVGTIVLTGGMNGCAMQVNVTNDSRYLIFLHDRNGKALDTEAKRKAVLLYMLNYNVGIDLPDDLDQPILRIDESVYMQDYNRIVLPGEGDVYVAYFPITVKTEDHIWKVYMYPLKWKSTDPTGRRIVYDSVRDANGNNLYLEFEFIA